MDEKMIDLIKYQENQLKKPNKKLQNKMDDYIIDAVIGAEHVEPGDWAGPDVEDPIRNG